MLSSQVWISTAGGATVHALLWLAAFSMSWGLIGDFASFQWRGYFPSGSKSADWSCHVEGTGREEAQRAAASGSASSGATVVWGGWFRGRIATWLWKLSHDDKLVYDMLYCCSPGAQYLPSFLIDVNRLTTASSRRMLNLWVPHNQYAMYIQVWIFWILMVQMFGSLGTVLRNGFSQCLTTGQSRIFWSGDGCENARPRQCPSTLISIATIQLHSQISHVSNCMQKFEACWIDFSVAASSSWF